MKIPQYLKIKKIYNEFDSIPTIFGELKTSRQNKPIISSLKSCISQSSLAKTLKPAI
jgi:hypothetical protein